MSYDQIVQQITVNKWKAIRGNVLTLLKNEVLLLITGSERTPIGNQFVLSSLLGLKVAVAMV
jgi:hypothetical protein